MNQVSPSVPSAKWQACVSTIKCDAIDDYVSIMVRNDWSSQCTWYKQYKAPISGNQKGIKPDRNTRKKIDLCQGPSCSRVTGYRDQLIQEEQEASRRAASQ